MKKKIKDGSLYFHQRDILRPLGLGMLIVGVVWFYFGRSMASYYIPGIITPLGLILFFVGGSRTISEKNVEERLTNACRDYDRSVTEMAGYDRIVLRQPAPVETSAYDFGEEAAYFKRSKNSSVISDRYVRAHFFCTSDALIVVGRRISVCDLLADEGGVTEFSETFAYSGIIATLEEHATRVTLTIGNQPAHVKWCELRITDKSGAELLRLPVPNDITIADLCDEIARKG